MQNSVFECVMDYSKYRELKTLLENLINKNEDSIRFYFLGDKYQAKIEHIGTNEVISVDKPLIF